MFRVEIHFFKNLYTLVESGYACFPFSCSSRAVLLPLGYITATVDVMVDHDDDDSIASRFLLSMMLASILHGSARIVRNSGMISRWSLESLLTGWKQFETCTGYSTDRNLGKLCNGHVACFNPHCRGGGGGDSGGGSSSSSAGSIIRRLLMML
jgi:hypothetical protein